MTTDDSAADETQPPTTMLRFETPSAVYANMPHLPQMTQQRPMETENALNFLLRLRGSTTPEEAITFVSFAVLPKMAIWWGYECLRDAAHVLSAEDRAMMELVAIWTTYPDNENRYRAMKAALYAPVRTPAIYLGLAVGWSSGQIAPNDPSPVPAHRAPRAINTAVLSCLARVDLAQRQVRLARFINQATLLTR